MVYCGKPSEGCYACRARKVKCDQAKPACNHCIKANRKCPGYRDRLSLWFRDESQSVARKAKAASSSSTSSLIRHRTAPPADNPRPAMVRSRSVNTDRFDWTAGYQETIEYHLPVFPFVMNAKFQATCFFFSSYAWLNIPPIAGIDPDCDLVPTAPLGEKALITSITSVGMANLASLQNSKSLHVAARREYTSALKLTNTALSDPIQAKEDTTLSAIFCLSLFEILTCKKPKTIDAWVEHTRGVIALLELRGEDQLARESGLQMFHALRNEIVIGCLQKRQPLPPSLMTLSEREATITGASTVAVDQLTKAIGKLCDLRIAQRDRTENQAGILSRAFALDSELAELANNLPPFFSYTTATSDPNQPLRINERFSLFPYQGVYHIYDSIWISNVWNNYRYTRILVNELVLEQLQIMGAHRRSIPDWTGFRDQCHRVRELTRILAGDICATVPFQFGLVKAEKADAHSHTSIGSSLGGFSLLYPLYVAASVDGIESPMFKWVISCFDIIARVMGIHQALAYIEMLSMEQGMVAFIDRLDDEERFSAKESSHYRYAGGDGDIAPTIMR